MKWAVVLLVALAGCAELPEQTDREPCPSPGYVRSAPLLPVPATAQPPADALAELAHAFGVAPPDGEPEIGHSSMGEMWLWQGQDNRAVAHVTDGVAVQVELRVNGTRWTDAHDVEAAIERAAGRIGIEGHAEPGGIREFSWHTGIHGGGGLLAASLLHLNETLYRMEPAYVVPDDVLPLSVYGSTPGRALVCTLGQAGAFLGASGAELAEVRYELDSDDRLEKVFVYQLHGAECERQVHVRFDARSGNLLQTQLRPC